MFKPFHTISLVALNGPETGKSWKLPRNCDLIVGRSSNSNIGSSDPYVSRSHCRIYFDNDVLCIEDLGSAGGTRVNSRSILHCELNNGDHLTLGNSRFEIRQTWVGQRLWDRFREQRQRNKNADQRLSKLSAEPSVSNIF